MSPHKIPARFPGYHKALAINAAMTLSNTCSLDERELRNCEVAGMIGAGRVAPTLVRANEPDRCAARAKGAMGELGEFFLS